MSSVPKEFAGRRRFRVGHGAAVGQVDSHVDSHTVIGVLQPRPGRAHHAAAHAAATAAWHAATPPGIPPPPPPVPDTKSNR